jgi:hypothetical protein
MPEFLQLQKASHQVVIPGGGMGSTGLKGGIQPLKPGLPAGWMPCLRTG